MSDWQIRFFENEKSQIAIIAGTKTILLVDGIESMHDVNKFIEKIQAQLDKVIEKAEEKLPPW